MQRRKHTHCGACRKLVNCLQLEVMWRLAGVGPWTWVSCWTCGSCREGGLGLLERIGVQLTLWDG